MGLSYIERNVFIFLKVFNFYLWPFPVQWDKDFEKLYITKPTFKNWGPPILVLAFTFVYGISSALTAFYMTWFYSIERIEMIVLLFLFAAFVILVLVFTVLAHNQKLFILFVNEGMLMAERIQTGKLFQYIIHSKTEQVLNFDSIALAGTHILIENQLKFGSLVKFSVAPMLSISIIVVPAAYVATGLDPFQYVFEEILGDPIYRSNYTIVAAILIRFLLFLMACVELFRSIAFLYTITLVALSRWKYILVTPVVVLRNASTLCRLHIEYRLLIKAIQTTAEALLYLVLSTVFWGIVVLTWICVKCSPIRIGYTLYIIFAFTLCLLTFGVTVVLPQPCKLLDLDSVAVSLNILMAKKTLEKNELSKIE